jgi:DNA-binding beta-propeller fold protein YncE
MGRRRPRLAAVNWCLVLLLAACGTDTGSRQGDVARPGFKIQHGWPVLPDGFILGFVTGVDVDSHDHVFTFHTYREWQVPFPEELEQAPAIQIWDLVTGTLIDSWGANAFRMPHGLSVDAEDHVWVTDVGHNQVFKFTHDGELQFVLGEAGVEGSDSKHFAQPTDVDFGLDGSVYVSDGYVNARIVNFSDEGDYRFEWGLPGDGPGEFDVPHDLAIDGQGRVYVADRENDRIQVFAPDGVFLKEWSSNGLWRPYGISVAPDGSRLFVVDGGEQPPALPDRSGVVVLDQSGDLIGQFGRFGNQDGQFMMAHDVALDREGNVLVVDGLQKFNPQ